CGASRATRSPFPSPEQQSCARPRARRSPIKAAHVSASVDVLVGSIYGLPMTEKSDALLYHSQGRPGKIELTTTKPLATQRHLALAYTPGVAEACLAIKEHVEDAYRYTAKGNLVAVVTNGTAVLGL